MLNLPPRTLPVSVQMGAQLLSPQSEQLFMLRHSMKEANRLDNLYIHLVSAKQASSLQHGWCKALKQQRNLKVATEWCFLGKREGRDWNPFEKEWILLYLTFFLQRVTHGFILILVIIKISGLHAWKMNSCHLITNNWRQSSIYIPVQLLWAVALSGINRIRNFWCPHFTSKDE